MREVAVRTAHAIDRVALPRLKFKTARSSVIGHRGNS
jgi:hypothetical protein